MDVRNFGKKNLSQLLVMIFIITACNPMAAPVSKRGLATSDGSISTTGGSSSGSTDGTTDDDVLEDGSSLPPKVEIRHLIEPNLSSDPGYQTGTGLASGGGYVKKLTLPKNFAGKLYVAGINVGTLSNRIVRVRFKWGLNRKAIPEEGIPATIIQAPGITPQTPISVLVLDLKSEPFRNVRLPYDLFDYNEYDFSAGDTPVQDNRNTGLYCRGLQVADDPSFVGVGACDGIQSNPDQPEEECLYAYAKVADQGLVRQNSISGAKLPMTPNLSQIMSFTSTSYYQDYLAKSLLKPLPDTIATGSSFTASTFLFSQTNATTGSPALSFPTATIWDPLPGGTTYPKYFYRGPYRLMDSTNWQFRFSRLDGAKRLFKENSYVNFDLSKGALPDNPVYTTVDSDGNISYTPQDKIYYNSYLFPLATKLKIGAGVGYLGSSGVEGSRSVTSLSTSGETLWWMDGSNARAQSKDAELNHIGSCNVSSSIDIIAKDDNGVEYTITQAIDVKLQLVRPTVIRPEIGDVLAPNFRSCSSNSSCGSSECCLNGRCWDESLVSQCFDENEIQGNKSIGSTCASDLECSSLCCGATNGQCAPHNTTLNPAVLCSKPVGSFCIAKDWCAKQPITKCIVVSQPNDPVTGEDRCTQSCYTVYEYGDCKNGACTPVIQPPIPVFNPADPNRCDGAVPAPDFSN